MTDIFISYSRKDIAIARLLHSTLQKNQLIPWIDWERIPVGEKWWDEICSAIENANAFLFIISKNSISSKVCKDEIGQAIKHHKRIIPILIDGIEISDLKELIPDLSMINWIALREGDAFVLEERVEREDLVLQDAIAKEPIFQETVKKLEEVIRIDWDIISDHTRLEVKAGEWTAHNKENSYLLRSRDLADAEQFLVRVVDTQISPTDIQNEFIHASRRQVERGKKATLIGAAIALIAAVGLAVFAYFARTDAIKQEDTARIQAHSAFLRQLSAQVKFLTEDHTDVALLLGLELDRLLNGAKWPTGSFLEVYDGNPRILSILNYQTDSRGALAFSPDGSFLVEAGCADINSDECTQGKISFWTASEDTRHSYNKKAVIPHAGRITRLAFDPASQKMASIGTDFSVLIWDVSDLQSPKIIGEISNAHSEVINQVLFSSSGLELITASDDRSVKIWDISNPANIRMVTNLNDSPGVPVKQMTISAGGVLAVAGVGGILSVYDIRDISRPRLLIEESTLFKHDITSLEFDHDALILIAGLANSSIIILDFSSGNSMKSETVVNFFESPVVEIQRTSTSGMFSLLTAEHSIGFIEYKGEGRIWRSKLVSKPDVYPETRFAVNPRNTEVASTGTDGKLILWDTSIPAHEISRLSRNRFTVQDMETTGVAYYPANYEIALSGCKKRVDLICNASQVERWNITHPENPVQIGEAMSAEAGWPSKPVYSPDGRLLAVSTCNEQTEDGVCSESMVYFWDIDSSVSSEPAYKITGIPGYISSVIFNPDGKQLATLNYDNSVTLWDISDIQNIKKIGSPLVGHEAAVTAGQYMANGKILASVDTACRVILWDLKDPQKPEKISNWWTGQSAPANSLAISPNGSYLVTGSEDRSVAITDLKDLKNPTVYINTEIKHDNYVNSVLFNSDSSRLFTGGYDALIKMWDFTNPQQVVQYGPDINNGTSVNVDIALSPNGKQLVAVGGGKTIIIYDLDETEWPVNACKIVNRNLTADEWKLYMGDLPYHETCPDVGQSPIGSEPVSHQ